MRRLASSITWSVWLCLTACSSRDGQDPRTTGAGPTQAHPAPPAIPEHAMPVANAPGAMVGLHAVPLPGPSVTFGERGGVAEVVEQDGRFQVTLDGGRPGKAYAAVGEVAVSPDGRRYAYGALVDGSWRMVVDGKEGPPFDAVKLPAFSPDGAHLAYQAMRGELWHLVVDATVSAGTSTRYLSHEFSGDSSRIAFVDGVDDRDRGRLVVSDLRFRNQTVVADSGVSQVLLDAGRSRLAAIVASGGRESVLTLRLEAPDRAVKGAAYDAVSSPAFGPDGSIAYLAERSGARLVVLDGREAPVVAGQVLGAPVVIPRRKAVGVLLASPSGAVLVQEYFVEEKPRDASYEQAEGLVYSSDGRRAYAAQRGATWFAVLDGKEGPPFDRVVTPVFSADGRLLAYRARKDGRRFVVVADTGGARLSVHPAYEQVFPVRFTADGKSIAYGAKDGAKAGWKVEAP